MTENNKSNPTQVQGGTDMGAALREALKEQLSQTQEFVHTSNIDLDEAFFDPLKRPPGQGNTPAFQKAAKEVVDSLKIEFIKIDTSGAVQTAEDKAQIKAVIEETAHKLPDWQKKIMNLRTSSNNETEAPQSTSDKKPKNN